MDPNVFIPQQCHISASQEEVLSSIPGFRDSDKQPEPNPQQGFLDFTPSQAPENAVLVVDENGEVFFGGSSSNPVDEHEDESSSDSEPIVQPVEFSSPPDTDPGDNKGERPPLSSPEARADTGTESGCEQMTPVLNTQGASEPPNSCSRGASLCQDSFNGAFESDRSQSPATQVWSGPSARVRIFRNPGVQVRETTTPGVSSAPRSSPLAANENAVTGSPAFDRGAKTNRLGARTDLGRTSQGIDCSASENETETGEEINESEYIEFTCSHLELQTQPPICTLGDARTLKCGASPSEPQKASSPIVTGNVEIPSLNVTPRQELCVPQKVSSPIVTGNVEIPSLNVTPRQESCVPLSPIVTGNVEIPSLNNATAVTPRQESRVVVTARVTSGSPNQERDQVVASASLVIPASAAKAGAANASASVTISVTRENGEATCLNAPTLRQNREADGSASRRKEGAATFATSPTFPADVGHSSSPAVPTKPLSPHLTDNTLFVTPTLRDDDDDELRRVLSNPREIPAKELLSTVASRVKSLPAKRFPFEEFERSATELVTFRKKKVNLQSRDQTSCQLEAFYELEISISPDDRRNSSYVNKRRAGDPLPSKSCDVHAQQRSEDCRKKQKGIEAPKTVIDVIQSISGPLPECHDFGVAEFSAALRKRGFRLPPFT